MENRRSRRKPGMREETEREIISRQRTAGRREEAAGVSRESAGRSRNRSGSSRKPEAVPVRKENFVIQGTILAVAGIIVRLIGILYRVPMTNIIGDEGMGYYSTAFNVYNIMLILSSYSLPLAVSKTGSGPPCEWAVPQYEPCSAGGACLCDGRRWFGMLYYLEILQAFLQRPCLTRRSACMHSAHLRQRSGSWRIWACCAVISRDMER